MKILTIKEPYATLICNNVKKIETRSWKTNYRGELYIHASKSNDSKWNDTDIAKLLNQSINNGKILCKCKLVDCICMTQEFIDNLKESNPTEYKYGEYRIGRYAWILDEIEQIEPIEAKGNLNIWNYYNENEIMNFMEQIEYGWKDKKGNKHIKLDSSIKEKYCLQSPKELIKSKLGLCIDQVELERYYSKYLTTSYIIVYKNENLERIHTFITYKKNNKYYWFEHAWTDLKGIYEYASLEELLEDVKNKYIKFELKIKINQNNLNIYKYTKPKYNITLEEFLKHCKL